MMNILSVDVEDYHDQLALDFQDRIVPPEEEAVRCTERLLELFARHGVKGTFFILGEIAEHFPALVRRIAGAGHHLGIHGYYHLHAFRQTPAEFRSNVERAKKLVEDTAGREANAHRAVAFSINPGSGTMWALPILMELGFKYDSSIFPFKGRRYGMPEAPRGPHILRSRSGRTMWEVPLSTVIRFGRRWPVCGGGYLRHFPLRLTTRAIARLNAEGLPAVMYLHPYELETAPNIQPLVGLSRKQQLKFAFFNFHQLRRRNRTAAALDHLLTHYPFGSLEQVIAQFSPALAQTVHIDDHAATTAGCA